MSQPSRILRLPVEMKLFNKNGEMVQSIKSTKRTQVTSRLLGLVSTEWKFGVVRVWYSKPEDCWNETQFTTMEELQAFFTTAMEKSLINYLKPIIPQSYLEKRKMSPLQRAALAKAKQNSSLKLGL